MPQEETKGRSPAALAVASGILFSRLAGLLRERVFAHYLGNSEAAGAFRAALRVPNLLQNLFGEGVLSASFIPVYSRLLAEGKEEEAGRVAGIVLSLLACAMALLVVLGVAFSGALIEVLAPGFQGPARDLTIRLTAIMFPGTGLLVLSAWCLGVLNSHRRFFLSYSAPVLWNVAIIAMLLGMGGSCLLDGSAGQERLVVWTAWATVLGAGLQLAVQFPSALKLNGGLRPALTVEPPAVQRILSAFSPAVLTRGVVQLSAYIDQILASFLGPASVAAMAYAQTLYTLPVSLFGMAVSAAELPEMSRATGTEAEVLRALEARLSAGLRRIAFYVVPSAVAFVALGDVVTATLFQTGRFGGADSRFVWLILAGSSVGLVATTQCRLCVSVFWALGDTKTPMRFAAVRVALTAILGALAVFPLRSALSLDVVYCSAALTASAGVAGWVEFFLVRAALWKRIGPFSLGGGMVLSFWGFALAAAALGFFVKGFVPAWHPAIRGLLILGLYGSSYMTACYAAGSTEAAEAFRTVRSRLGL